MAGHRGHPRLLRRHEADPQPPARFDGGWRELGPTEADIYRTTTEANAEMLQGRAGERDIVIVHDPQPAGLVPSLRETGAAVIWRCHVGIDDPNDIAASAWDFLRPYVAPAHSYVFS